MRAAAIQSASPRAAGFSAEHGRDFLGAVEQHMLDLVAQRPGVVADAAAASIRAGGKRLRPLLVLAGRYDPHNDLPASFAAAPQEEPHPLVRAAAAIELIHTASLIHDDVLDAAALRRSEPTVLASAGYDVAVAAGDLLFSLAFATVVQIETSPLLAAKGAPRALAAVEIMANAARMLAEGEAMQAEQTSLALPIEQYELRCARKTGSLFAAALKLGATISGAPRESIDTLGEFGTTVGIAFQISDDVLDCRPSEAVDTFGKAPGADVLSGTVTLPLIFAAQDDPRVTAGFPAQSSAAVRSVLALIDAGSALHRALDHARALANEAQRLLRALPSTTFDLATLDDIALRSVARSS